MTGWSETRAGAAAFQDTPLPLDAEDAPPAGGITRPVPWFGAKAKMGPKYIVPEMGEHRNYIEPFCGSCAVLFAKPQVAYETVNDLHGDLTHLLRCLQDEATALWLYGQLARTCMAEGILLDARAIVASGPPPAMGEPIDRFRAAAYLTQSWMMRNGMAGTDMRKCGEKPGPEISLRFNISGGSPTVRWVSMVESIPAWHLRLRSVMVLQRDAFKIIDQLDDEEGLVLYLDPPYLPDTRSGLKGPGTRAAYLHEFEASGAGIFGNIDDHTRLADALCRFKHARVIVSYYAHPRLAELYPGWTVKDCAQNKNMSNCTGRGERDSKSPEVLLINGPSYTEGAA
ncbi:MAG: DNA adenine methylase [Phycisphaera sp.]|nr:MAG: DNA adenine methylase [Phycisphaera sp.]